jgi:hypothetical protein
MLSVVMLSVIILSVVILSVIILSVVMLSVIMLSVIMLSVVILSVVAPHSLMQLLIHEVVSSRSGKAGYRDSYQDFFMLTHPYL